MGKNSKKVVGRLEKITMVVTDWMGTPWSILLHTFFFIAIFGLKGLGMKYDQIMLVLTTVVSLEAIYLSLFIQMTVNRGATSIEEVSEDVEGIEHSVNRITNKVTSIEDDVDEISRDVDEIAEDVVQIQQEDAADQSEFVLEQTQLTLKDIQAKLHLVTETLASMKTEVDSLEKKHSSDQALVA